jgi:hypothetical protein
MLTTAQRANSITRVNSVARGGKRRVGLEFLMLIVLCAVYYLTDDAIRKAQEARAEMRAMRGEIAVSISRNSIATSRVRSRARRAAMEVERCHAAIEAVRLQAIANAHADNREPLRALGKKWRYKRK